MKKAKIIVALLLALVLVAGICGCGKKGKTKVVYEDEIVYQDAESEISTETGDSGKKTNGKSGSKSGDKISVKNNCYSSGEKIAKDKITFNVLARDYTNGQCNYNTCAFTKYIESKLNIKLNWTLCSEAEVSTKLTLAYASGKNPYDLYFGVAPTSHTAYINQGKLTKLNSYINEYGPNIKKLFKDYPEAEYICTAEDNGIYMLPFVNDHANYCDLIYVNKTWLKNVGEAIPKTTNDLKAVLTAFKKKYPSKTPFVCTSDNGTDVGPSVFGMFGISTYHTWMYLDGANKVQYAPMAEEYKNGLRYFNSLYGAGLLSFKSSEKEVKKLTDADGVGMVLCDSPDEAFAADNFNKNWTMVPVLNTSEGGTWANVKYENTWAEWCIVTKSCKYPECAVRLCDWLYSTKGTLTASYGPEGNYWNYDSTGNVQINNDKIPAGKSSREYIYSLTPSYCIPKLIGSDYNKLTLKEKKTTPETQMSDTISSLKKTLIAPYAQQKNYYPHFTYLKSESAKLSEFADPAKYVYDMRMQFITGTKNVNSDWDSYVNTLKSTYKMESRLQIVNTAYKRYCAWYKSR